MATNRPLIPPVFNPKNITPGSAGPSLAGQNIHLAAGPGSPALDENERSARAAQKAALQQQLDTQLSLAPKDVTPQVQASIANLRSALAGFDAQDEVEGGETLIDRQLGFFDEAIPADSAQLQRQSLRDLFAEEERGGVQSLVDLFNKEEGRQQDEAATTGALRQPGFQSALNQGVRAQRGRAISELLGELGSGRARGLFDVGQREQDIGLDIAGAKSGIVSGESQFGRELGLGRERLQAETELGKSGQRLDELFRRDELSESARARNQRKKSTLDKVQQGFQIASLGIGSARDIGAIKQGRA